MMNEREPKAHPRRALCTIAALVVASASIALNTARAEPPAAPVQIAFLNPLQLIDEERSITAFRLALLHTANRDVRGFDLATGITRTDGTFRGLQIGAAHEVYGGFTGVQFGALINYVEGGMSGAQIAGVASYTDEGTGMQLAPVLAKAKRFRGFQLGLITKAEELEGLQLGLLNFNKKGFLPFFPLFNFGR